jgi:hypothetical protein
MGASGVTSTQDKTRPRQKAKGKRAFVALLMLFSYFLGENFGE